MDSTDIIKLLRPIEELDEFIRSNPPMIRPLLKNLSKDHRNLVSYLRSIGNDGLNLVGKIHLGGWIERAINMFTNIPRVPDAYVVADILTIPSPYGGISYRQVIIYVVAYDKIGVPFFPDVPGYQAVTGYGKALFEHISDTTLKIRAGGNGHIDPETMWFHDRFYYMIQRVNCSMVLGMIYPINKETCRESIIAINPNETNVYSHEHIENMGVVIDLTKTPAMSNLDFLFLMNENTGA